MAVLGTADELEGTRVDAVPEEAHGAIGHHGIGAARVVGKRLVIGAAIIGGPRACGRATYWRRVIVDPTKRLPEELCGPETPLVAASASTHAKNLRDPVAGTVIGLAGLFMAERRPAMAWVPNMPTEGWERPASSMIRIVLAEPSRMADTLRPRKSWRHRRGHWFLPGFHNWRMKGCLLPPSRP